MSRNDACGGCGRRRGERGQPGTAAVIARRWASTSRCGVAFRRPCCLPCSGSLEPEVFWTRGTRPQLHRSVARLETRLLEIRVYAVCQDHVGAEAFRVQD